MTTVATGLEVPWDLAFLPDGRALLTERAGAVRVFVPRRRTTRAIGRVDVSALGEGGLLGIAVDPAFAEHPFVYVYRTTSSGNQVVRFRFTRDALRDETVLVSRIPSGGVHNGGRLRFGPDDHLYFATGDAGEPGLAQDASSLAGKFLRLPPRAYRADGARPQVVSIGHRNPQGFDWEPRTGRLVATEHGPDGDDEINAIRMGGNYGWPSARGDQHRAPHVAPLTFYPETVAPSGATFVSLPGSAWTGDLLVATLRGKHIRRLSLQGSRVARDRVLYADDYGRIRVVVEGPDGAIYALTNNTDGRGSPRTGDDRILRIIPPAA